MAMYKVSLLSDHDYPKWTQYLDECPTTNFFFQMGWLKVVQRTYAHKPFYLMATCERDVRGILPLFLVSSPMFGRVLASDVFTSYGGVCADDPEVELCLMEEAVRLATLVRASYLEIKNSQNIQGLGDQWQRNNNYCTMIVDLTPGANNIWSNWHPETRRNVRKAIKSGIRVERGPHLFDDFYRLVTLNMRQHGTPVHSKEFYRNIIQEFGDEACLFVARLADQPVAGSLTLGFKTRIQSFVGASNSKFWKLKPNDLLYWEIIQHACDRGFTELDFGRSTWESGTFHYKKHIGARPLPLYYDYYLNRRKSIPQVNPGNKSYWLATQLWRYLPLELTKVLGPHIIKYVV